MAERRDFVNDNLYLIQNTDGLTFGTDALLLAAFINSKGARALEIGSGTGIISMLLLSRGKASHIDALEVQESYAELTRRNAEENSLSERLHSICADIREFKGEAEYELIFSNPPYMKTTSGRANLEEKKNIARHEVHGDIYDFLSGAKRLLKYGGSFAAVYRTDRLCDLTDAMRKCGIEPKRMTFVFADCESEPSMVLVEGRRGGACGLKVTSPLLIYKDRSHKDYTADMDYIMENGSFPEKFKK